MEMSSRALCTTVYAVVADSVVAQADRTGEDPSAALQRLDTELEGGRGPGSDLRSWALRGALSGDGEVA